MEKKKSGGNEFQRCGALAVRWWPSSGENSVKWGRVVEGKMSRKRLEFHLNPRLWCYYHFSFFLLDCRSHSPSLSAAITARVVMCLSKWRGRCASGHQTDWLQSCRSNFADDAVKRFKITPQKNSRSYNLLICTECFVKVLNEKSVSTCRLGEILYPSNYLQ